MAEQMEVLREELARKTREGERWRRKEAEAQVQVQQLKEKMARMRSRLTAALGGTITSPTRASGGPAFNKSGGNGEGADIVSVTERMRKAMSDVAGERDWLLREVKAAIDEFGVADEPPTGVGSEVHRLRRALQLAVEESETLKLQLETLRSVPLAITESESGDAAAPVVDHKAIVNKASNRVKRALTAHSMTLLRMSNPELTPKSLADGVALRLKSAREQIDRAQKVAGTFAVESETLRAQLEVVKYEALKEGRKFMISQKRCRVRARPLRG